MIQFIKNLIKALLKKKEYKKSNVVDFTAHRLAGKKVKWIRKNLAMEKTEKGYIFHAIDCDLTPSELMEIIKREMKAEREDE